MANTSVLWHKYQLSASLQLKNRIIMAPLTRCFADEDLVPTAAVAKYYADRADCGLIISEGTIVDPMAKGYPRTPGIFNQKQVAGWKKVTQAVHKNEGLIFLQLWHTGRVSHPFYLAGKSPVSSSAVALKGRVPRAKDLEYGTPRALSTEEVRGVIDQFRQAAVRAKESGFDGVEIHGANGYLLDQFLRQLTNLREDEYGGSIENRVRMPLELVDAVAEVFGSDRVGLRLSPGAYFNMTHTSGDEETFVHLLKQLEPRKLAYVHLGIFDDSSLFEELKGKASAFLRKHYKGQLIGSGSYDLESGEAAIAADAFDSVAIGRAFIANADLISRAKTGQKLEPYTEALLAKL